MALTVLDIEKAKPKGKRYMLADSGGLYIEIMTTGSKIWRVNYSPPKRWELPASQMTYGHLHTKVYGNGWEEIYEGQFWLLDNFMKIW